MTNRFLMCPPTYFDVSYEINPHMHKDDWFLGDWIEAQQQWRNLLTLITALGAKVELLTPVIGLPDMVFTANAGHFKKGIESHTFYGSVFRYKERRNESKYFMQKIVDLGYMTTRGQYPVEAQRFYCEGAGDIIWDSYREVHWGGYGFRTDKITAERYSKEEFIGDVWVYPHALELINPKFYHLDTCFCPLPDGEIMYWPGAFSEDALDKIANIKNKHMILLTKEEAEMFCANAIVIDDNIIMSQCTDRLKLILNNHGYSVFTTNLSKFMKAGGSAACLTLRLP